MRVTVASVSPLANANYAQYITFEVTFKHPCREAQFTGTNTSWRQMDAIINYTTDVFSEILPWNIDIPHDCGLQEIGISGGDPESVLSVTR